MFIFATSMKNKEKRPHCRCVFMDEVVCQPCKNKQKEYATMMKKVFKKQQKYKNCKKEKEKDINY